MQNKTESKIKLTEKGTFITDDERVLKTVPCDKEPNSWYVIEATPIIELDEQELLKAKALGCDLEKVLIVKKLIAQKITPTQISKQTGFSRSTVYRYKELLSEKNTKRQVKNSHSTKTFKSVFPIWLIYIQLDYHSTFLILFLLFTTFLLLYIKIQVDANRKKYIEHKEQTSKLHFQFTQVCNLTFRKEPIVCASDKEAAYYKKLLAYYRNKNRDVCVIPINYGERNDEYFDRKEYYRTQYSCNNAAQIKKGKERLKEHWIELQERNLLDYLHFPKGANWLESKAYLLSVVDFLEKNPAPKAADRANKKTLIEMLPSPKLSRKEIKILEKNEKVSIPKPMKA